MMAIMSAAISPEGRMRSCMLFHTPQDGLARLCLLQQCTFFSPAGLLVFLRLARSEKKSIFFKKALAFF